MSKIKAIIMKFLQFFYLSQFDEISHLTGIDFKIISIILSVPVSKALLFLPQNNRFGAVWEKPIQSIVLRGGKQCL